MKWNTDDTQLHTLSYRPASWGTTRDQIRAYYSDPLDLAKTTISPEFFQQLNRFSDELKDVMNDEVENRSLFVDMVKGAGLAISAGLVAWFIRGGTLLLWFLSLLPAWRYLDPIPILGMNTKDKETWNQRVNEASKLESREHQGIERIFRTNTEEVLKNTSAKTI